MSRSLADSAGRFGLIFLIAFLGIGGCAHDQIQVKGLPPGTDPSSEISKLSENMTQARSDGSDLLSPEYFEKCRASLEEAKKLRTEGKANPEVLEKVAESQAYYTKAIDRSQATRALLKDVDGARKSAIAANAPKYFQSDFKKADTQLKEMASSLEQGNQSVNDKEENRLAGQYQKLADLGVKETYQGEAKRLTTQAKSEGAPKWAPKTLKEAEGALHEVDSGISNHLDSKELERLSSIATQKAQFLLRITREAKLVKTRDSEDTVLRTEKQNQELAELGQESQSKEALLERKENQIGDLEQGKEAADRLKRVRQMFSPDEAVVLSEGNQILLRLKGLHFPTASKEVQSQDFALLAKVKNAISELGPSNKIVVEGHTDATGSKKKNDELSLKRAQAVRNYLAASPEIPSSKIEAEGKGFSEPIASDKTKEGRSQNRRVDIVVETTLPS